MPFTRSRSIQIALVILSCTAISTAAEPTDAAPNATEATISLEQIMLNNLRKIDNRELMKGMRRATPDNKLEQPLHLSFFSHSNEDARTAILQKFPVGTTVAQTLQEFPLHFVLFGASFDERNGVHVKTQGKPDQTIGTRSIIFIIDKYYPVGIAPVIQYRFARFAFNAQGKLLDVSVITETDAI